MSNKCWISLILMLSACCLRIAIFADSEGQASSTSSMDDSLRALKTVARSLEKIENNPSVTLSSRDLVYAGINGMFRTLDPYTQFLDEDAFDYMKAQQQGSFYGIGISFDVREGELLVISPIEESPAWHLGIRAGDVIEEIDGETVAGITSNEVIKRLRGDKGSVVQIGIRRRGVPEILRYDVIRDKINLNSARGGFMISPETGYVRLTEFSSTTYPELMEKLASLSDLGMKQLILDLRFNGGGLLSAAEQISSAFLKEGQTIVSTKGRAADNEMEITCKKDGTYCNLPVIILVNDSSASASEIVAGAIQDHDRGLVIGTSTHGKGLVGSQFQTRLGTAAQITTAQYFTPSGRFIQRPFNIPHRKSSKTDLSMPDSNAPQHHTDQGRQVFERGGITPDVIVEEPIISPLMYRLELQRAFFDFAVNFANEIGSVDETFIVSDRLLNMFIEHIKTVNSGMNASDLDSEKPQLKAALCREIFAVHLNADAADKVRVMDLHAVKEALKLFPEIDSFLISQTPRAETPEMNHPVDSEPVSSISGTATPEHR
ncbi:S41 family peptidase [bacterium]|nr:S41 family peptidase [candidate division CSSED10-310 bacterium]